MTMYKTILAPNAPWYTKEQLVWPTVPEKPKRKHRAKPADIDKRFEAWLSSIERIKK